MARSEYIWIVKDGGGILNAFTVKHELISFLAKHVDEFMPSTRVLRVRDGGPVFPLLNGNCASAVTFTVKELLP